ncbi:hypothetical protein [Chryseobacterium contaminans]|uniref:hypothetical protein n=1 Tax=Chryseobacterium contaminans TaxID=1423959 RepID=UPI0030189403
MKDYISKFCWIVFKKWLQWNVNFSQDLLSISKSIQCIKEFDYFMSGMVYFSMGVDENLPEKNIINPYIHLIKMLDAAHLILERRGEKV